MWPISNLLGYTASETAMRLPLASRGGVRSATRTTSIISSLTPCTRTICAPKRTLAATAAAVPHSRASGVALAQRGLEKGLARRARQYRTIQRRERIKLRKDRHQCSAFLANPRPGSTMIASRDTPAEVARAIAPSSSLAPQPARRHTSRGRTCRSTARVYASGRARRPYRPPPAPAAGRTEAR